MTVHHRARALLWLLPALVISVVFHVATYTHFDRIRVILLAPPNTQAGDVVRLDLPQRPPGSDPLPALILGLRNKDAAPLQVTVAVGNVEIGKPVVPGSSARRFYLRVPPQEHKPGDQLTITGAGSWDVEYAEIANIYGYASGAVVFVVTSPDNTRYRQPSPPARWLLTLALLLIGATQRSLRHRAARRMHMVLIAAVMIFLALTLLAPVASGYSIVLSLQTLLLCAVVVHAPGAWQLWRNVLSPALSTDYLADGTPRSAPRHDVAPRGQLANSRLALAAAAVVVVVAVALFVAARIRAMAPFFDDSDLTVLGLYTQMALHGDLLVGPYSRFGWHHPGPIYFYVLAPFYWLTDQSLHSLSWTAAAINLGSIWLLLQRLLSRGGMGSLAAGASVVFLYILQTKGLVTSPWNPHVTVIPLAAFVVLNADLASSARLTAMPLIVLVASFLAQTHVGYVPCAGALMLTSLVLHWRFRRHAGAVASRTSDLLFVIAAAVVVLIVWAPPMTERWNLQRLWDFFRTGGPGFNQEALGAYVHTMTALLFGRLEIGWGTILPPAFDSALGALTLGQIALLGPVSVWASRRGRHFHAALALIALIGSLAAFWSLGQVRGPILDHLVFWVSALSVINFTVILAVVTSQGWDYLRARQLFPHGVHRWLVSPWLPALLIVVAASYYLPQLSRHQTRLGAGSLVVKSMFVDLKFHLDHHHVERPMFRIAPRAWGAAAGVILELSKARQQFFIEPFWAFMFTRAYLPDGTEDAEFDIVDSSRDKMKFLLTYEPVARAGDFSIYRQLSLGTSRRLTDPVRIVGTVGTRGNAVDVVDGRIPPNGADWNAAGTLQFDGRSSSITFVVPPTANGIALSADGNDSWRFECSADGATFEFAGIVPVQQGPGLQTREVHFRAPIPCRQLRLSPETGDGSFSMGEVTFLATPFTRGLSR